jgi:DNA repair exonuclease SbcCD nuclease subunit
MRTRILHLADLHLGDAHAYLGSLAAARQAEADRLLSRIVDQVLSPESTIGGVVIAGDLFDSHDPPPALVESVLDDLARLDRAGIRLLTVPGNHDEYSYPSCVYRRPAPRWPGRLVTNPEPERVDTWTLGDRSVDLYAMAFVAGRSRPPYDRFAVDPGDARKIAVLHGSLDADWSDRSLPLKSANLAELGLDYVALGHIHRPLTRRLGSGWICYPGRIEGGSFDDPGGAGLVEIDLSAPDCRPLHRPFPSREIANEEWNVSGLGSAEELEHRLEGLADRERIVRLDLAGVFGFAFDPGSLRNRWRGQFHFLELVVRAEASGPIALEELAAERTVRGTFATLASRRLAEETDPEHRRLLEAALRYGLAAFASGGERDGGPR